MSERQTPQLAESADTEAVRLATISAEIREYLIAETDVTMPGLHATALTHRIAPLLRTPPEGGDRD